MTYKDLQISLLGKPITVRDLQGFASNTVQKFPEERQSTDLVSNLITLGGFALLCGGIYAVSKYLENKDGE